MPELLNKAGIATRSIARILCGVEPGERIPTVTELTEMSGAVRGNVQRALAYLKEDGAVELEPHGQKGTTLIGIDYLAMARACGIDYLVGAMPLPYTARYEGLATGLFTILNESPLHAYISFVRGSEARVQGLVDGFSSFCVMSRMAYLDYVGHGFPLQEALDCGPYSYVGRHVLIAREAGRKDWTGARIGIDRSSADQRVLTERYFAGEDVAFVPVQYTQILSMLADDEIDAGIWNEDDLLVQKSAMAVRPIERAQGEPDDDTRAVVVVRKGDALTRHLLTELVDIDGLIAIQRRVMSADMPARY